MKYGKTVPDNAGDSPGHQAHIVQEQITQQHGQSRLHHVAQQGDHPRSHAEYPGHVGGTGISAALLANVPSHPHGQAHRHADRAKQIARDDNEQIL